MRLRVEIYRAEVGIVRRVNKWFDRSRHRTSLAVIVLLSQIQIVISTFDMSYLPPQNRR